MSYLEPFQCNLFEVEGQGDEFPYFKGPGIFFLILSLFIQNADCVFTSAGISPTFKAFVPLSPFETLLLGMVLLQIFVLQLYGIVPFDLNKILHGDFSGMGFTKTGRKRRMTMEDKEVDRIFVQNKLDLADKILSVILLTDHYDCLPRTLCEVRKHSTFEYKPPALFVAIFHTFNFSQEKQRRKPHFAKLGPTSKVFEEAIEIGDISSQHGINSTACEVKYSSCPLTTPDIMTYILDISMDDFV